MTEEDTKRLRELELKLAVLQIEHTALKISFNNLSAGVNRGLWILGGGFLAGVATWIMGGGLAK